MLDDICTFYMHNFIFNLQNVHSGNLHLQTNIYLLYNTMSIGRDLYNTMSSKSQSTAVKTNIYFFPWNSG